MKASERFTTASGEKAHNITALISPQQPRGPSMETWIKGISPVAVYISLIVPASPSSQSIHYLSGYCSSPPSWWWGLTKKKKRRKRLLKTGAVEQSLETPPRLDPPVQEHDLLLGFYEACSVNTNSFALFFFSFHALSVLKCTNVNKHAVAARGKTISHEEKPHNEHTFCCRLAGFLVRGNEAGPNQTASGGILRQTYVLCTFDVLFSAA